MEMTFMHPDFPDVSNFVEILEQTHNRILTRIAYPDGVVVLVDITDGLTNLSCSHQLLHNGNELTVNTNVQNMDFVDEYAHSKPKYNPVYLSHVVTVPENTYMRFISDTGESNCSKSILLDDGDYLLVFDKYYIRSITTPNKENVLKSNAPLTVTENQGDLLISIGYF
ncbi:hypothetical protein NHG24_07890 [Aerococcaceae bacterium NML210727]|nr:hypothetical protein [Aerococcaceae bacterium NML210727]MCW6655052.1 hypothetical protein [Aerococcaceae bacterium NML201296]